MVDLYRLHQVVVLKEASLVVDLYRLHQVVVLKEASLCLAVHWNLVVVQEVFWVQVVQVVQVVRVVRVVRVCVWVHLRHYRRRCL
jgi:hypothetical protein